jgi:hypothetical protein
MANGGALAGFKYFGSHTMQFQSQGKRHAGGTTTNNRNHLVAIVGGGTTNC